MAIAEELESMYEGEAIPDVELFRTLLDAAPDAIVAVNASGRILLVNAQAESLFGYGREDLIGEQLELLVPEASRGVHQRHRHRYMHNPVTRPMGVGMELAGRRKDGTEFPAEISLSALDTEDGRIVSAAVRDVTERREALAEQERLRAQAERERLEARMHQSQRLESLGQLAGGVAHDFNNLLGVILNYTTFIGEELAEAAAAPGGERWRDVHDDLEQVHGAAERAAELTQQLLAFGRREVVDPQPVLLTDLVRDVDRLLRRTIGDHVELTIDADDEVPAVLADRGQLEQVLLNLTVNARDAMPGGGRLTIAAHNVELAHEEAATRPGLEPGPHVQVAVSDTGVGMDREVLEHAFEPFFTTKPKGEGSGLGLATVHGIVTQARGHVEVDSQPGVGTTVSVLLPARHTTVSDRETTDMVTPEPGGETVLVVDDQDALRELTRRLLVRNGYTALTAASGAEAVQLARDHDGDIHVLLTDVVMPRMLGREVATQVRQLREDVRVLYMSGYAQPVLASQGTLDHGVVLIEKPFTEAVLLDKLRAVLEHPTEP